jgi:hypothetical protein
VAKFWAQWPKTNVANVSYNLTSITDTGAGDWTLTIATDFSGADWCALPAFEGNNQLHVSTVSLAAGTVRVITQTNAGTLADPDADISCAGFGDQA